MRGRGTPPPQKKNRENVFRAISMYDSGIFGQIQCKIVDFSAKYPKSSGILIIFRANIT